MIKKIILTLFLCLALFLSTREADNRSNRILPEVTIIGKSIEREIFDALVLGKDSVLVKNGSDTLYINIEPLDSSLAKIVLAQARLESDTYNSPLAVAHNNYFGIMYPSKGKMTTALHGRAWAEGRTGYCSYATPEDSALDLILMLDHYKEARQIRTPYGYVHYIKSKHYFEADERLYLKNLKLHLKDVQQYNFLPDLI